MRRIALLAALASLALSGCAALVPALTGLPPSPVAVADQVKVDEQIGLTVTLAYTAAAKVAALAIRTGVVKDPATIAAIGAADGRAYAAVIAVHEAYAATNSASYVSALTQAREAIADLIAAVKGT